MDAHGFYRLTGPTEWKTSHDRFSYSSLKSLEECVLRWQLLRSSYGGISPFPEKPSPAAEKGSIIHSTLEKLFRGLAQRGLPAMGSASFKEAIKELNALGFIKNQIEEHNRQYSKHPRAQGYRMKETPLEIHYEVSRLFQAEYKRMREHPAAPTRAREGASVSEPLSPLESLRRWGVLSELELNHPTLPLHGIIDMLADDDGKTRILDFKSGKESESHRDQLELYALLWLRCTGDMPSALEVRYPSSVKQFTVEREKLEQLELKLAARITEIQTLLKSPPTPATKNEHCRFCGVRQFCNIYWEGRPTLSADQKWVDIELRVEQEPTEYGFVAKNGTETLSVVFDEGAAAVHGEFHPGEMIRVLGASFFVKNKELRLWSTTEVFRGNG